MLPPLPLKLLGTSLSLCLCYITCEQYILGKRGGGVGAGRVTKGAIYDVRRKTDPFVTFGKLS